MHTRQLGQSDLDTTPVDQRGRDGGPVIRPSSAPHGALDRRVHRGIEEDNFASSCCPGLAVPWPSQAHRICSWPCRGGICRAPNWTPASCHGREYDHRTVVQCTVCGALMLRSLSPLLTTRAGKAVHRQRRKRYVGASSRDRARPRLSALIIPDPGRRCGERRPPARGARRLVGVGERSGAVAG